jgi:Ca2+-binding EF-hand superfamily protein
MSTEEIRAILADENKLNEVVKAAFESVDTDDSGFIDAPELKKVMSSVAGDIGMPEPSDSDVIEVMRELDANNDGKIS